MKYKKIDSSKTRGAKIIEVDVPDSIKFDPNVRKSIQLEIEEYFIPMIKSHKKSRGSDFTRGEDNKYSDELFSKSEVLNQWKNDIPTTKALYPLQKPQNKKLADGTKFDDIAQNYFPNVLDGVAIRSRATLMSELIFEHLEQSDDDTLKWGSLASGAAVPVFEAADRFKEKKIDLTLADISGSALKFAKELFEEEYNLDNVKLHTHKINILNKRKVKKIFGESSLDVVDILGFFEYVPSKKWRHKSGLKFPGAINFLHESYKLLKKDGILIFGNILDSHPHLEFTLHVVQWPYIIPRSTDEVLDIIEEADIPLNKVTIYKDSHGVYNVIKITKS